MAFEPLNEFIPLAEVCKQYGISRRSLYNYRKRGRLQIWKLEGRSFIRRSEFQNLFEPELPQTFP